jgi:hypothetical protein
MIERTTDIVKIKNGGLFTWGETLDIVEFNEYVVVKYHPWKIKGMNVLTGDINYDSDLYHSWLNGKDTCHSSTTLEGAIVDLFALKYDGLNSHAGYFFARMIGIPS